ncbi:MAG: LLM class flavin-dependent oxidoreductase [Sphingomonadaceae bacterium]|nr:LLM class flavin-dependent oxidoreductase [Sphingomonadaceae bacterium]
MHVPFTMDFRNPLGTPWKQHWEDCLWLMTEAEAMGFDALLIQEHFFSEDGYSPSVPVFLTALAERTSRARIGSYTYILPIHHAAQLAQETAVLDHFSEGRLDVCVGAGHNPAEYLAWGYSPKTRPSRMEEGLSVLKGAWTERPFNFDGRYYTLDNVGVYPEPFQKPHPPLWVAATSPPAAARAGRHGAFLHGASIDPEFHEAYLLGREEAGLSRETARISNPWSFTVTQEDPEVVWQRNREHYQRRWRYYSDVRSGMGDDELNYGLEAEGNDLYRDAELIGTAEHVIETMRELIAPMPLTDIVHSGPAAGIPIRTEGYESLKAFADTVLPELKSW